MIWLKKVRNDRLYDGKFDVAVFLQQMMEIYVDCKISSIWVTLDEKEKAKFFNTFSKPKKLSSYINFGFAYFSKSEYQLYPELLKQTLSNFYEEYLQDFTNVFSLSVKKMKFFYDPEPGFEKSDALDAQFSFYLCQGMWSAIRLFPSGPCKYETCVQNGAIKPNYDFLNGQLFSFDRNLELTPIINTVEFYQKCAEEVAKWEKIIPTIEKFDKLVEENCRQARRTYDPEEFAGYVKQIVSAHARDIKAVQDKDSDEIKRLDHELNGHNFWKGYDLHHQFGANEINDMLSQATSEQLDKISAVMKMNGYPDLGSWMKNTQGWHRQFPKGMQIQKELEKKNQGMG